MSPTNASRRMTASNGTELPLAALAERLDPAIDGAARALLETPEIIGKRSPVLADSKVTRLQGGFLNQPIVDWRDR